MPTLTRIFLALCVLAFAPLASANLITNPGFETGDVSGWTCATSGTNANCDASVSIVNSGSFSAVGFDNEGVGSLSQIFATVVGAIYDVSFWVATNQENPVNVYSYSLDGGAPVLLSPIADVYTEIVDSFVAAGAATEIAFFFDTDSGTGALFIDDVSVTAAAVPAPATLALFGLGLAGFAFRRKGA